MNASRAGEERRDEVEGYYRAVFETMGPAVLLMRGTACVDCNPATLALFGIDRREEILGKTPLDFAPAVQPNGQSSAELVQQNVRNAIERGTATFEWQSVRKNGEPFIMEVRFTPCGPAQEQLFLCIAVDISVRRRAEDALRSSEQRFRTIVESATEAMGVADMETQRLRYVNPALCRLLGYGAHELLAMRVSEVHPTEGQAQAQALFAKAVAGLPSEAIALLRRKDGSIVEVSARCARLELDGRPCIAGLFWDLSERRLTEAERQKTQKLEALGVLAGGIAHDFNNLLQGALGGITAARVSEGPEQARAMLDAAEEALKMAARLTGQLLTFSRGGAPLKQLVALGALVTRSAQFALSGSSSACEFDLPEQLWPVEADEAQLEQVVQNLVLNASQAMPTGGTVRLKVRNVEAPEPVVLHSGRGAWVAISVEDFGSGIPEALLPRIFDPYFTTKASGTGLGLSTAYSVVRRHGGYIDVKSQVGAGSTFTVFLPAFPGAAPAKPAEPTPAAQRKGKLLLMDDAPSLRLVTAHLLGLLGHQVETAAHGAEAVELYREAMRAGHPYDLVILDLTVRGGMGGCEALARLREIDPQVRALVCSGYSDDPAIAEYRAHGFSGVLRKPHTLEMLQATVAEQLNLRHLPVAPPLETGRR